MKVTSSGVQTGEDDRMPVFVEEFHPDAWAQLTRRFPCVSVQRRPAEVRPGEPIEVLQLDDLGWTAHEARWGLHPAGTASPLTAYLVPVETLGVHRTFRGLLDTGRCVIPLAAYWDAPTTPTDVAVRVLVSPVQPAPLFAAGLLLQEWTAYGPVRSCAVITRPAAPALAGTVTRMPALLREEELHAWMTAPSRAARVLARDSRAGDDLTVTRVRVTSASGTGGFTGY